MWVMILGTVFGTSLLSGFLGMAGGVILMGVFVALLPISSAMVLHGVTQSAANGFRGWLLREHICWKVFIPYVIGALFAVTLFFTITFVPEKPWVFIGLGSIAILNMFVPKTLILDLFKPGVSVFCGVIVTSTQLFIGVSGAVLDVFYINSNLTRFQIIATKAVTQTLSHLLKLFYYGSLMVMESQALELPVWIFLAVVPFAFAGTSVGRQVLRFVDEKQFRLVSRVALVLIGCTYVYRGTSLLMEGGMG